MAYTLVGNCYIGTGSLPTPVVGYDAIDTSTGNRYTSNTSSTAWVLAGNVNQVQLGGLPITGGTMTGAIAGATGWAPKDSPLFTTSAKLDGVDLATMTDLTDLETSILTAVTPQITTAVASTTAAISVSSKIAIGTGQLVFSTNAAQTIPLPYYPGNIQATESECKWAVWPTYLYVPTGKSSASDDFRFCFSSDTNGTALVDPTTTRTFVFGGYATSQAQFYPGNVSYMIIGVRA